MQFSATIREIYRAISNAHWNVNIGVEERKRQEEEILKRTREEAEAARAKLREEVASIEEPRTVIVV